MPEIPLWVACQNASLPIPLGATTPSPVMTTRRCPTVVFLTADSRLFLAPISACENEQIIHATKTAGVCERHVDCRPPGDVWHVVEITERIRILLVNRRRDHLGFQYQGGDNSFNSAGRTLCVAVQRFCGANGNIVSPFTKVSFLSHGLFQLVDLG